MRARRNQRQDESNRDTGAAAAGEALTGAPAAAGATSMASTGAAEGSARRADGSSSAIFNNHKTTTVSRDLK